MSWHGIFIRLCQLTKLTYTIKIHSPEKSARVSEEASFFPQVQEWALLGGRRISQRRLREATIVPELQPVEVVRAHLYVIFVAMMLEEQLLVTPE